MKSETPNKKRVLAVSSSGGHLVQLQRVLIAFDSHEISVMSTYPEKPGFITAENYIPIKEINRKTLNGSIKLLIDSISYIRKYQPHLVISTGAAPGIVVLFSAFILRKKTVWLDSIANSEKLSLSCRIAKLFCTKVVTQWPELSGRKIKFAGRVV